MGLVVEALLKVAVELALEYIIKKHAMSILWVLMSAMKHFC